MIEFEADGKVLFYATTAAVKDTQIELQLICKEHEIRIIGPRVYLDGDPLDVANYFGKEDRPRSGKGMLRKLSHYSDTLILRRAVERRGNACHSRERSGGRQSLACGLQGRMTKE